MSTASPYQMCPSGERPSRTNHVAGAPRSAGGNPHRACSGRMQRKGGAAQGASRSETQVLLRGSIRHAHPDASRCPFGCDASKRRQPQAASRGSARSAQSPLLTNLNLQHPRAPAREVFDQEVQDQTWSMWCHRGLDQPAKADWRTCMRLNSKRGTSPRSSWASRRSHPEGRSGGDLAPLDLARALDRPPHHDAKTLRPDPTPAITASKGAGLPHAGRDGDLPGREYGTTRSRRRQLERRARHILAGVLGPWLHRVLEVCAEGNTHAMTHRVTAKLPLPGASSTARMASDATRSARWTEERGDRH